MGQFREAGLSDALGAIMLVAVIGMGIALAGVFIFSQPHPEKIPALTADITTIGRTILITHNGGDSLEKSEMAIIVDGTDRKDSFLKLDGSVWTTWAVGDSLLYRVPDSESMPEGITIYYIGGTSARMIQSVGVPQTVSAGGIYGTGTATPTPTPITTPAPTDPVTAAFAASPVKGLPPLSVQFIDTSAGPVTSWVWSFGDSGTSNLQNPVHQYMAAGLYTVSLTVSNGTGSNTLVKTNYINVTQYAPGLLANYYSDQSWSVPAVTKIATRIRYADTDGQSAGYSSDIVTWPNDYVGKTDDFSVSFDGYLFIPSEDDYTFYLTSDDGSWLWIDGSLLIDNGGLHSPAMVSGTTRLTPGYHPIRVRMFENTGNAVVHLEYSTPSVARTFVTSLYHLPDTAPFSDFTATPRAAGIPPLTVQFTDTSVDASGWEWDFGDGSAHSYAQNPQHTYTTGGSYTVSLTTTNSHGSNTATKAGYIVIGSLESGLLASYYYGQTWTDPAGSRVDARVWFADPAGVSGGYATDESGWPSTMVGRQEDFSASWDGFLYVPTGDTYTFYLTSDDGSWLWIDDALVIDNGGLHSPREYSSTVTLESGYHSIRVRMYENTGEAVAHLEYSTPSVARTVVTDLWHVPATPVTPAPVAGFTGTPTSGALPLTVRFSDTSTGTPTSWSWDFGDGDTTNSTTRNPVHIYTGAGTFTVTLTASNAGGSDDEVKTGYITVGSAPVAAFSSNLQTGMVPLTVAFDASLSTGSPPLQYSWDLNNDGTADSTFVTSSYTYTTPGRYTVKLNVTNGYGSDDEVKTAYITATPNPAWYSCSWAYRKNITINRGSVSGTLTNFPVLLNLPSDSGLASHAMSSGYDILFTSSDGTTKIPHEIEKYTSSTGALVAWVRVPSVQSAENTTIFMYYGNAGAANQQAATSVWTDYTAVWHMTQDPSGTAPQILDSTANGYHATSGGSMTTGDQVPSKINGGLDFDGSNDYLSTSYVQTGVTAYTVEAWIKTPTTSLQRVIVHDRGSDAGTSGTGKSLTLSVGGTYPGAAGAAGDVAYGVDSNSIYIGRYSTTARVNDNAWHHVAGTWSAPSGTAVASSQFSIYVDGNLVAMTNVATGSTTSPLTGLPGYGTRIAQHLPWNTYLQAVLDEVRISTSSRSADWIKTEYYNQNSPSTFYYIRGEEQWIC